MFTMVIRRNRILAICNTMLMLIYVYILLSNGEYSNWLVLIACLLILTNLSYVSYATNNEFKTLICKQFNKKKSHL